MKRALDADTAVGTWSGMLWRLLRGREECSSELTSLRGEGAGTFVSQLLPVIGVAAPMGAVICQHIQPPDGQGCGQKPARALPQRLTEAAVTLVLPSWEPLFIEKQAKVFGIGASPDR